MKAAIIKLYRLGALLAAACIIVIFMTGCRDDYRYSRYRTRAENALHEGDYSEVARYYSIIYDRESGSSSDPERYLWAYYRLGVVAELTGDVRMAMGYYWGDQIDEGFYSPDKKIDWLSESGWKHLDEGNPPRTLEQILQLELQSPPVAVERESVTATRERRTISIPEDRAVRQRFDRREIDGALIHNRSLTPPPPGTKEPFRVFY